VASGTPDYEDRLVKWGLKKTGRVVEPHPEGLRVEEVLIETEEIVAPSDPYPGFLNAFHMKTKDFVLRQELVIKEGEVYRQDRVDESARNLRRLFVLATARIVPVKGHEGGVALLVVAKDLWSIRLNTDYLLVGNVLEYLSMQPSEQNFLGLNAALSGTLLLKLDTLSLGQGFTYPRLLSTWLSVGETAAVIVNRHTHEAEGSRGSVSVGKPLYTLEDTWGFNLSGAWDVERVRVFRGPSVWQLQVPGDGTVADEYNQRNGWWSGIVTRSLGERFKTNLNLGLGGYHNAYTVPAAVTDPVAAAWFAQNVMPRSQAASYLLTSVQAYEARYTVLKNLETFSFTEDYQLGYSAYAAVHWAEPAFLSPLRFLEGGVALGYTWLLGGDLLGLNAAAACRWQIGATGQGLDGPFVNRRVAAQLFNATPMLGPGRVVTRLLMDWKAEDLSQQPFFLGGDDGLRGTPAQAMAGTHLYLANLEYRTLPFELWTLHVGGVLFYDVGTAYNGAPQWTHVVGVGLRLLIPQFDTVPLRVDFGYVIQGTLPNWIDRFTSSFGQVTDQAPAFLTQPL
jgi:hypothetical protein